MEHILFMSAAAVSIVFACLTVSRRNPVYAVVAMLPFFLAQALLLALLCAPFLAAMQVMVYGGAIMVLFLFVLMLISLRPEDLKTDQSTPGYLIPAILAGLLGALLVMFILTGLPPDSDLERAFREPLPPRAPAPEFGTAGNLSREIFGRYLLPFELISVLLVAAMLGVVLLVKKKL